MTALVGDRVRETTTTTGTGDITLAGAATRSVTFNTRFGIGARFLYVIEGQGASGEWETGQGYLSGATTLVRETVYHSSNGDALVNFSAGTKDVFCSILAEQITRGAVQSLAGSLYLP